MQKTLTYHYQNLHQIPELDSQLPKTQEYILSHLPNCEITLIENGGILAYYHKNQETTIALRCEMDALPILEQTNLPYQSTHTNCMHACAHDAHMAILLTLAHFYNISMFQIMVSTPYLFYIYAILDIQSLLNTYNSTNYYNLLILHIQINHLFLLTFLYITYYMILYNHLLACPI